MMIMIIIMIIIAIIIMIIMIIIMIIMIMHGEMRQDRPSGFTRAGPSCVRIDTGHGPCASLVSNTHRTQRKAVQQRKRTIPIAPRG